MTMLAVPVSCVSWQFRILQDGDEIAHVHPTWFKESAALDVQGRRFGVHRESRFGGRWTLSDGDTVLASAEKPSAFARRFEIRVHDRKFGLEPPSAFGRRFELRSGKRAIGAIRPVSCFSRRAQIDLPDDFSLPVRVFLFGLVLFAWRRQHNAAASGGG